jgi:hypothetical protein
MNDELYRDAGNDLCECRDGLDVIIDFDPSKGDTHTKTIVKCKRHL